MDLTNFKQARSTIKWTTNAGDDLLVKHMETSHVQNTIILLTRKLKDCQELNLGEFVIKGANAKEWIELLQTELKYRQDPKSVCPPILVVEEPLPSYVERRSVML